MDKDKEKEIVAHLSKIVKALFEALMLYDDALPAKAKVILDILHKLFDAIKDEKSLRD